MILVLLVLIVALAVIAAACNVVSASLGLGLIPAFPGSWVFFAVKNYIADLLLWCIVGTGLLTLGAILADRRQRPAPGLGVRTPLPSAPDVLVVLTAFNEREGIQRTIEDFARQPNVRDVLVIDNNSTDDTALLARRAGARVVFEARQGYGYACMRGLREAVTLEPDVVVLAEGDGTFAGRDVAKLLPYLDDSDMVVGNRVTPGLVDRNSQMDSFFVWGNVIGGKLLQWKFWDTRFLGKTRLSDLGCTFRAMRAEALADMVGDLWVGGHYFSPHMILAALRRGLLVVEVPVTFCPRMGVSHGASQSLIKGTVVGLQMLWHILTFPTRPVAPATAAGRAAAVTEDGAKAA